jgi:hypothetical protein
MDRLLTPGMISKRSPICRLSDLLDTIASTEIEASLSTVTITSHDGSVFIFPKNGDCAMLPIVHAICQGVGNVVPVESNIGRAPWCGLLGPAGEPHDGSCSSGSSWTPASGL